MNVIFLEPSFPDNQRQFVRALREAGATVIGIGERPGGLARRRASSGWLAHYEQVPLGRRRGRAARRGAPRPGPRVGRPPRGDDRGARDGRRPRARGVRIPGTSVHTAYLCRDKPAMKEALRAAGVPCAALGRRPRRRRRPRVRRRGRLPARSSSRRAARAHRAPTRVDSPANSTGRSRAAASTTAPRSRSRSSSRATRASTTRSPSTATWPWTSSRTTTRTCSRRCGPAGSRRSSSPPTASTPPGYDELRAMGRRVIGALGIGTSATHMEWFAGPEGPLLLGDRLPAAGRARLGPLRRRQRHRHLPRVGQRHRPRPRRPRAVAALRRRASSRCGPTGTAPSPATRASTPSNSATASGSRHPPPPPGTPTQPVEAGYMANAWVRMRHPDYDRVREMLDDVGRTVHVRAT